MKTIYNNGALHIQQMNNFPFAAFRLHFECAGVKKTLFLTDEQVTLMAQALSGSKESPQIVDNKLKDALASYIKEFDSTVVPSSDEALPYTASTFAAKQRDLFWDLLHHMMS